MLGAIIGDIVGSRFEFDNTTRTDFELFSPECSYTDDTICTVAIADAILRGTDFGSTLHRWCRKYPYPMGGYGGSFARWVHSNEPQPYSSFGNGSAMRVSPCGWLPTRVEALATARAASECTHNHPEGIKGAVCIADCIYAAAHGADKATIRHLAILEYGYEKSVESCDYIRKTNSFNETCQVTVPQAIACFLESTDFESAIRLSVSIGGDSDTIAAIAGSLAEAYYGIPANIEEKAMTFLPQEIIDVLTTFRQQFSAQLLH